MMRLLSLTPLLLAFLVRPGLADSRFTLEATALPRPMLSQGKLNAVVEASAVQSLGDRGLALVAHDKLAPLHVLEVATGELVGEPIASPRFLSASKAGPKWEGLARDGDGSLYVIGSHGGATDEEIAAHSVLTRFRLGHGETPSMDDASVARWDLSRPIIAALRAQGVGEASIAKRKVEGLAIREANGVRQLVVGLRAPTDRVRVFAADITHAEDGAEVALRPLFEFSAGASEGVTCELTSLEYVPNLKGFLVLTSTEDELNVFHGNTLWFVADGETSQAHEIARFEVAMKAEGLSVVDAEKADGPDAVNLLVVYDNDALKTKIPSRFQTFRLVRNRP